jgi:hypothetical protein
MYSGCFSACISACVSISKLQVYLSCEVVITYMYIHVTYQQSRGGFLFLLAVFVSLRDWKSGSLCNLVYIYVYIYVYVIG